MLILLPPSETKRPGGVGISIDKAAIIWAALDPAREILISALTEICQDPKRAIKALKLGARAEKEISKNQSLMTSPTMPALERYSGVLFDAIDYYNLSEEAIARAGERLFIQSALFGLLPAMEQIPDYRFSAGSRLPGINLRALWHEYHALVWPRMVGPILDLRSKEYQEINPIPKERDYYVVEVLGSDGKLLNHFNKRSKGLFVRAALENGLDAISQLPAIAKIAGLKSEVRGRTVKLFAP